jgi:glycosyltransferase involved in cell wall biosynthesis
MRILMTTDTVGGVWSYTTELIGGLLRNRVAVALVTLGRKPSPAQHRWLQQTSAVWREAFRWDECKASLEWMSNNEGAFCDVAPLLLRVAHEFRAELLHSNQFCFGALPVSIPRLVVAHSDVLSWAAACRSEGIEACAWLDTYIDLCAAGLRDADAVVAPTRWMLDALGKNFELACEAYVIPNGRTPKGLARSSTRKLQAITAGRLWDEAKNLKLLQDVHAPLPILVAGDTEYESQTAINLPPEITILGHLAEDKLLSLFQQSAIYLCTSVYEPFGLAPLEAALCGCAVLANDIPSLHEVWGDGAVYFHNAASLQDRLAELVRDPEQLALAQRRSWLRAQRYAAASMTSRYLALYQTMLTTYGRASHVA